MGITTFRKNIYYIFLCITLLAGYGKSFAQCPTVSNPNQSFCDIQSPTVSSLAATNNGNGVVWYATATSTTPLSGSSGLANGEDYFADDNSGTCGSRQSVTVTIYSAPTGQNFQGVCVDIPENATIADLIAVGNAVQWYNVPNGGIALPSTTQLVDNTIYYASQTNPNTGCQTSRLSVFVNVGVVPVPTGNPLQVFCNDPASPAPTVGNLFASGNNNWYLTSSSAAPLDLATPLIDGQSYFATTVDPPCESINRFEVVVDLLEPNDAGTNGTLQICQNLTATTPPLNLFSLLGGTPDNTGTWTGPLPTSNGFQGTVNVSTLTLAGSPYVFTYTVTNGLCAPDTSTVTITILPLPTVSIAANTTICSGTNATVTFTGTPNASVTYNVNGGPNQTIGLNGSGTAAITATYTATTTYNLVSVSSPGTPSCTQTLTGSIVITVLPLPIATISSNATICFNGSATVTFTGTPNATVTYNINGGASQTILLNGSGTAAVTGNYTATTVFNLVSIATSGTPSCTRPLTGTVTITVVPLPIVSISSNATICPNGLATVTFSGTPNATVTYTVNGGPNQTILLNGTGTATITSTYTVTTVYTLVSVATSGTPSCSQPQTGSITITVLPLPVASLSADVIICSGNSATVTFTGTPNATVTYNINGGPNQTIVLNGSGTATVTAAYTATTTFNLVNVASSGTPSCSQPQVDSMVITVLPPPTATIANNTSVCPNGQATVNFTGTPNATVTYTVNGGPAQTILLNATGTASITTTYTTTTTYNLVSVATSGTPSCSSPVTGTVVVTVLPLPVVTISSNTTICSGGTATVTFTGTPNSTVIYTVNGGPDQTIVLNGTGTATITGTYTTTTIFNLVSVTSSGTPACSQPQTGSITITVLPLPVVSIAANSTICAGDNATITFTGTPNATVTYNVNGGPNQTIVLSATGTATITSTFNTTTTYNLVSVATSGTPSCSQPQTGSITITVLPLPAVSISANATICTGGSATVTFTGTPNATVVYTVNGGPSQNIVLNGSGTASITGTYTTTTVFALVSVSTSGTPGCSQPQTGSVTITVVQQPVVTITGTASVCPNGQATITFNGTPNATVIFTINNGPNQSITMGATGTVSITTTFSTTTTYTLVSITAPGTPPCSGPATGSVTITVLPLPVVSIAANSTICAGENATVTFTGTPGSTITYTINGGTDQTITLNAAGTANITGSYSVTTTFSLVSASLSGCSQPQTGSVVITVLPVPAVSLSSNVTICSGSVATVTFTGTPNSSVVYTVNNGPNQTIVLNAAGTASITANYTVTTTFMLVNVSNGGTPPCTQPQTGTMVITVIPLPTVLISALSSTVCSGASATITFTGTPNSIVTYTINNGPNQNITINGSGSVTISPTLSGTSTYSLVSVATSGTPSCSQPQTGSVTVTVVPAPVAGNDVTGLTVCSVGNPVDLFALLGPTAQMGGTWSPSLASGTGVFNPAVDSAGTYVYTVAGTPPCSPDTASVTITMTPPPNAGNDATVILCTNSDPQDLFALLGPDAQTGGTWSPTLTSGTGIFDPSTDPAGIYTYTVSGVVPCGNDTANVTIQLSPGPDAGLDGTMILCVDSSPQNLFDFLNGTPQAGGTWSPALSGGNGVFNPAVDPAGVYTYTFFGSQPCDNDTATVTVTVNPIPDAGIDGTAFFCTNYPASDLFTSLSGTPQLGGTWSPALASGTGVFNPLIDLPGVYTYTVGGNLCSIDTSTVTVSVAQSPDAGGPGATLNVCITSASVDLFTGLDGSQSAGTWADDNASGALTGNIFNPSQAGAGTYNFTYTVGGGVSPCLFDTATVTVIVSPQPNAGAFTTLQNVCSSAGTFDLTSLLDGTQQTGGIWTDANNVTVVNPLDVSGLLPATYSYTYTITNACGTDFENVQITILPAPSLIIPNITLVTPICSDDDAVITLSGMTDGTYTITYDLFGSNVLANQSVTVTIIAGTASFPIPSANLTNLGTTTISFTSITNTVTNCTTVPLNVLVNFVVRPASNIENADLTSANICLGLDAVINIAVPNVINLPDGNYQFNYSIPGAVPSTGSTGIVAILNGIGQFSVSGASFPNSGNYVLTITGIISLSGGCTNLNENASVSFEIIPIPNGTGATLSASATCQNFENTVSISNAGNLADGTYSIQYTLSGANSGTATVSVIMTSGNGSFVIPASSLANAGVTTVTVTQLTGVGECGTNGNGFAPVTFDVTQLSTPVLTPDGNEFCGDDNPTIQSLSSNVTEPGTVVWYNAAVGGTAYADTDLLQNGVTYYGAFETASGCESAVRLPVIVDLTVCAMDIIIPDGFSPNGDGINDDFEVVNLPELYPNFKIEIYNRYGTILYKGNIATPNWDGTAKEGGIKLGNDVVPVGVYFFIIEFNNGAKKPVQGRVYLSR